MVGYPFEIGHEDEIVVVYHLNYYDCEQQNKLVMTFCLTLCLDVHGGWHTDKDP